MSTRARTLVGAARDHWRITLLIVLIAAGAFVLFFPGFGSGNTTGTTPTAQTGPTNLQFGLELSGGTRVRAPLVGMTAEDIAVEPGQQADIQTRIANELGIESRNVNVYPNGTDGEGRGTIELTTGNVTQAEFRTALENAGYNVSDGGISDGVTEQTADEAVEVLQEKISKSPFAAGDVRKSTSSTGEYFVIVEVPGQDRESVINLIEDRGVVEQIAHYPTENGYQNTTAFEREDIASMGQPEEGPRGPQMSITLTEEGARQFSQTMQETGFTGEGAGACRWQQNPDDPGYCLLTVVDGEEVVFAAGLSPDFAQSMESGEYVNSRTFVMHAGSMEEIRNLRVNLLTGTTPAPLDIDAGTQYYLEPSLAQDFKLYSLVAGVLAVGAVSGVVAARYGRPRVAIPMILTASAEVFLLLGFAAAVGYPLDLAAIAGVIAVVGTGVDDLIIIADEILQEGEVSTGRVFESRFRKAFWVIGAAAATTIVAMSPLALLSLGDLTGFALFTIAGVLIGVLVTRPAYGDILRVLLTR